MKKTIKKIIWEGSTQLFPLPAVLVGCGGNNGWPDNLITIAWTGIVCSTPPMLSISVRPERYSHKIIEEMQEFSVNIPTVAMAREVDWCGVKSGRDYDKFKETGFTVARGEVIASPLVMECPVNLECRVVDSRKLGSHIMYLAQIEKVHCSPELLDENGKMDIKKADILGFAHGQYCAIDRELGHQGFSVKKK